MSQTESIINERASLRNDEWSDPWYRFNRVITLLERHTSIDGCKLLDIGCHQGQFIELLLKKFNVPAVGIDQWSPELKGGGNWRYLRRDLANGIDLEERFDIVSALEVIEHVIDTDVFLRDCNRLLKDDGYLVLTTPNINSFRNRLRVPFGRYPFGLEYRNQIHHVRLYNVACLRSHLKEHGFHVVEVSGVNVIPARYLHSKTLRTLSEVFSARIPTLCGNIIVIARK